MTATHWRDHALCRRHDPEWFFPVGTTGPAVEQAEKAKRICRLCPVIQPCLAFALAYPALEGIWAGTDHDQRRALRNARALAISGRD